MTWTGIQSTGSSVEMLCFNRLGESAAARPHDKLRHFSMANIPVLLTGRRLEPETSGFVYKVLVYGSSPGPVTFLLRPFFSLVLYQSKSLTFSGEVLI